MGKNEKKVANYLTNHLPTSEEAVALVEVEAEVWGLPAGAVHRPVEHVGHFRGEAEAFVAAGRADGTQTEETCARIEQLARALKAAQVGYQFRPMPELPENGDPGLGCVFDRMACRIETAADELVRSGGCSRADLPRAAGSSEQQRCDWARALVRFFRERGLRPAKVDFAGVERTARAFRPWAKEAPEVVRVTELRDRCYTVLRDALDDAKRNREVSGVFAIDGAVLDVASHTAG